jgi:gamma-glutamyl:cysteine ligase YbdK (ATP-grasp superfamily)
MLSAVRGALAPAITGAALAVLFSVVFRASMSGVQSALAAFYDALARHALTPQVDPAAQTALAQREQANRIQLLADDISGKLADRFAAAMARAVEPMTDEMQRFTQSASREQVRGVDALVSRFVGLLDERMGGAWKNWPRPSTA